MKEKWVFNTIVYALIAITSISSLIFKYNLVGVEMFEDVSTVLLSFLAAGSTVMAIVSFFKSIYR